jgi:hypothetical protein
MPTLSVSFWNDLAHYFSELYGLSVPDFLEKHGIHNYSMTVYDEYGVFVETHICRALCLREAKMIVDHLAQ